MTYDEMVRKKQELEQEIEKVERSMRKKLNPNHNRKVALLRNGEKKWIRFDVEHICKKCGEMEYTILIGGQRYNKDGYCTDLGYHSSDYDVVKILESRE